MPKATKTKGFAKQPKSHASYAPSEIVLGKVRGYPPWPGRIVDPADAPPKVKQERPGKGSALNGFSLVQFFPTGDYAWLASKDISKLLTHEIESYINDPIKRSGDLLAGYRIALKPAEWEAGHTHIAGDEEDAEADADGEEDELASEPTEGKRKRKAPTTKKAPKKSKKAVDAESEDEGEPPAKKAKKGKNEGSKKGKDEDAEGEIDAESTKDPKMLEVRDWRHKIQKTFLGHKGTPKETDMPSMDTLFSTVEAYTEMTVEQLTFSKIGKVMRHITALSDDKLPADADNVYKFKTRAKALVDRWAQVLGSHKEAEGAKNGASPPKELSPQKEESAAPMDESKNEPHAPDVPTNGEEKKEKAAPASSKSEDATMADPTTNGTPVVEGEQKMDEDKKPEAVEQAKETNGLMEEAFMGDLTMDMSVES